MEQIDFLEQELKLMLENIERLKKYKENEDNKKWRPYQCNVLGELKHRGIALKQRITQVSKVVTYQLFE